MAAADSVLQAHIPDSSFDHPTTLGKRKRTESEEVAEVDRHVFHNRTAVLHNSMRSTLDLLRIYDPSPSLLNYALPPLSSAGPDAKRQRLIIPDREGDSIERRMSDGAYSSYEDVLKDIDMVASVIINEKQAGSHMNGDSTYLKAMDSKMKEKITIIRNVVSKVKRRQEGSVKDEVLYDVDSDAVPASDNDAREGGQVLTLRSQTEKGPRQLFSGLQRVARLEGPSVENYSTEFDVSAPIDLKKLPNGFDLTQPASLEAHMKRKEPKPPRTLGDVFRPSRNVKALEPPAPLRGNVRGNSLDFISESDACFAEGAIPVFKTDYAYASLPTGQWLHYKDSESSSQATAEMRRQKERTFSFGNDGTRPASADIDDQSWPKSGGLFQAAYSSFAPSFDDSLAVVSERTRSDLWWQKVGRRRFGAMFSIQYPEEELGQMVSSKLDDDDFAEAVANFEPDKSLNEMPDEVMDVDVPLKEIEDLLQEISDLLQTLSSYQRTRHLDTSRSAAAQKPTSGEFDTYEMLKTQLSLLVSTLPPFAVAKLDGKQLEELNISTIVSASSKDYPGTGEPDDFALQKKRAAVAATSAAGRTPAAVQTAVRPGSYQTPAPSYAQRPQPYTTNQTYSRTTPSQPYQTPRAPASTAPRPPYPQATYGTGLTPAYSQQSTSLSQFQRPITNGYGTSGYNAGSSTNTPSQPGYQQRAQDNMLATYGRSASPQKPAPSVNGSQRPPQIGYQTPQVPTQQKMTDQQRMLAARQAEVMAQNVGQGSATALPQTPATGRIGLDAANETRKGSSTPVPAPESVKQE